MTLGDVETWRRHGETRHFWVYFMEIEIWGYPRVIIHFERWDFPVHKNHPAIWGYSLVICYSLLWKMTHWPMKKWWFSIEDCKRLPEGILWIERWDIQEKEWGWTQVAAKTCHKTICAPSSVWFELGLTLNPWFWRPLLEENYSYSGFVTLLAKDAVRNYEHDLSRVHRSIHWYRDLVLKTWLFHCDNLVTTFHE